MLKAIETVYNGYRFRSRLEARSAVLLDTLGIEYQYEPEGFDLGELGWYLPDFWLPQLHWWIEIKGQAPTSDELLKAESLSKMLGQRATILSGVPGGKTYRASHFTPLGENLIDCSAKVVMCLLCVEMTFIQLGVDFITDDWSPELSSAWEQQNDNNINLIDGAYTAARQARFEHGQVGAPSEWK